MKDIWDEKFNTGHDECYFCGRWSNMGFIGKCKYCGTQNDPPRRKISINHHPPYLIKKKSPTIQIDPTKSAQIKIPRGSGHHSVKLTGDQVKQIREDYAANPATYRKMGVKYNISAQMAWNIIKRKWWTHV